MVSKDLKIASIINDYCDGILPNTKFEDSENVLCEISYTGGTFSMAMEKYQNYLSITKIKEKLQNINLSYTSFSLEHTEKPMNKLDPTKGAPDSDIPTKIMA